MLFYLVTIIVLLSVFLIGYIYDVGFGLWKEHLTISTERNPFGVYLIAPPMGLVLAQTNLRLDVIFLYVGKIYTIQY